MDERSANVHDDLPALERLRHRTLHKMELLLLVVGAAEVLLRVVGQRGVLGVHLEIRVVADVVRRVLRRVDGHAGGGRKQLAGNLPDRFRSRNAPDAS